MAIAVPHLGFPSNGSKCSVWPPKRQLTGCTLVPRAGLVGGGLPYSVPQLYNGA